jgi:hypothetical protein
MAPEFLHTQLLSHKTAEHPIRISAKLFSNSSNNTGEMESVSIHAYWQCFKTVSANWKAIWEWIELMKTPILTLKKDGKKPYLIENLMEYYITVRIPIDVTHFISWEEQHKEQCPSK